MPGIHVYKNKKASVFTRSSLPPDRVKQIQKANHSFVALFMLNTIDRVQVSRRYLYKCEIGCCRRSRYKAVKNLSLGPVVPSIQKSTGYFAVSHHPTKVPRRFSAKFLTAREFGGSQNP
jgi:hypothetical protein